MEQVFNISVLKYKKEPVKDNDFVVRAAIESDIEGPIEGVNEVDIDPKENVIFFDARESTLVDRERVLRHLKRPIELQMISKVFSDARTIKESAKVNYQDTTKKSPLQLKEGESAYEKEGESEDESRDEKEGELEGESVNEKEGESVNEKEADEPVLTTVPKKRGRKSKAPIDYRGVPFDLTIEKIGKMSVIERIPVKQRLSVGVSSYYMNNRKMYISKLAVLFKKYSDKIAEKSAELTCKTLHNQSVNFDLLTHQLVIRKYLNLYTPYRGLLLFHGLGSGKTCTSIGVAEGMKSEKGIVLMTPASLKMNFFNELKKCGDVLYKKINIGSLFL